MKAAIDPLSQMVIELLQGAAEVGAIEVTDTRRTGALIVRTVMYSWFGNRLAASPRLRITAEETWEFCLHGLRGRS